MARVGRSRPRITWTGASVQQTGTNVVFGSTTPALGPAPPTVINPLLTQRMQTVMVQTVSVQNRRVWNRRFASQNQEQDPVKGLAGSPTAYGMLNSRALGPQPPQVILPLPTLAMMTVATLVCAVRTRITMPRRAPHYYVLPAVVEPRLQMPDHRLYVQTALTAVADRINRKRRKPVWFQTPVLLAQPPPVATRIQTTLAVANRRLRRPAQHVVQPPVVVNAAAQPPVVTTIQTALAARTRRDLAKRAPHSRLSPPPWINLIQPAIRVALAHKRRVGYWQLDGPVYALNIPVPYVAPPVPPVPPPVATQIQATSVAVTTRAANARWRLYVEHWAPAPAVLAPNPVVTQIQVSLAATGNRRLHRPVQHNVNPPAVISAAVRPPVGGTLVALAPRNRPDRVRRAPHSTRPTVTYLPKPVVTTLLLKLAPRNRFDRVRRQPRYSVYPPAVVNPFVPSTQVPLRSFIGFGL